MAHDVPAPRRTVAPWHGIIRPDDYPDMIPAMCRAHADEFTGGPHIAHVWQYDCDTDALTVRLELPDDHAAVSDAAGDGHDPDTAEFVAIVPRAACVDMDGVPVPDPRPTLAAREDARQRALDDADRAARVARVRAELVRGTRKSAFPELGPLRGR